MPHHKIDHDLIRKMREATGMTVEEFADFAGLSKSTVSKIENDYPIGRRSVEKYLHALGLEYDEIILHDVLPTLSSIAVATPKKIDFRPVLWPNKWSDRWRNSPLAITLIDLDIRAGSKGSRLVSVELTVSSERFPQLAPMNYDWRYWVALDCAEKEEEPDDNVLWRGEINRFGQGSSVKPREIEPGGFLCEEVMLLSDRCISWQDFASLILSLDYETYIHGLLRLDMRLGWHERKGTRFEQCAFNVPLRCLHTGFEATSQNEFNLAQYLTLRTLEGGYDACDHGCCEFGVP